MESGGNAATLSLRGALTISRIDDLHAEVLASLQGHPSVVLDCTEAEEVDVAFLQILIAAHRMAERLGKSIRLATPPSGVLADAIRRCGFPPVAVPTTSLVQTFSLPIQA